MARDFTIRAETAPKKEEEEPKHYELTKDGYIDLKLPKSEWELSAILVQGRGDNGALQLQDVVNRAAEASAVFPAEVMRQFFETFLAGLTRLLLAILTLVTVVAGIGILVSIYNSVSARSREIAILRALGATRRRVLALICMEAVVIGVAGGVAGLAMGHVLAAVGSVYVSSQFGEGLAWWRIGWGEVLYLGVVAVIALLAGLVPALKAYSVPVADHLVSG